MSDENNMTIPTIPINEDENIKYIEKPFYKTISFYVCTFLILFTIIFNLNFHITVVSGESMNPTLHDGQFLLAEKHIDNLERYDIIIANVGKPIIKRIIGLPGETVEYKDNILYINGQPTEDKYGSGYTHDFKVELANNEYYCLGDNRENSMDSRYYGPFTKDESNTIISKILRR